MARVLHRPGHLRRGVELVRPLTEALV
jgi:RimJ/RimL family protein N-acetyltransferase